MRNIAILSCLVVFVATNIQGQGPKAILRSGNVQLKYRIGENFAIPWNLNPTLNPDVLDLEVLEGTYVNVTFISDVDTKTFVVHPNENIDFVIAKDGHSYNTRIAGKKITTADLKMSTFTEGNKSDISPSLSGPFLYLEGNISKPVNLQSLIDAVRGCSTCEKKIDVAYIDLRLFNHWSFYSLADQIRGSLQSVDRIMPVLTNLSGVNSITYDIVRNPSDADSQVVADQIKKAEVVIVNIGMSCGSSRELRGRRVVKEIEAVYQRGGGIAGFYTGAYGFGGINYGPCGNDYINREDSSIFTDPIGTNVGFEKGPFNWSVLADTFANVGGRRGQSKILLGYLSQMMETMKLKRAYGIQIDSDASVLVDKKGLAKVVGKGAAYFTTADHKPDVFQTGKPLSYSNFKVWKIPVGETYDLKNRPKDGYYTVSVKDGKLDRDPY